LNNFNRFAVLLLCCFTLYQKNLHAETIHFSGTVLDQNNQPIAGAEVTLYKQNVIKVFTDQNGAFDLSGTTGIVSDHKSKAYPSPALILNGNSLRIDIQSSTDARLTVFSIDGTKIIDQSAFHTVNGTTTFQVPLAKVPSGISLLVLDCNGKRFTYKCAITANRVSTSNTSSPHRSTFSFLASNASGFSDILIVSAAGYQTVRRAVTAVTEETIKIKLMQSGVGYITPTIPVYSDKGGTGDVTTYGSPADPENSQGGACNYGSTKIKYYAAINVNQFPGDKQGQWQDGQICGQCAKVRVRTASGEERMTVVRIMDKCPDDNCGIDLGGAPAAVIMQSQAGRYAGEWEWVDCDSSEGVSDGPPSLYIKTGSNQWWSLVQTRNGPGSVLEMRVRKTGTTGWMSLKWATEAENFFKLPEELLQDSGEWDIEVKWSTGSTSTLTITGNKLSVEDAVYELQK
jgi:hypothetical protein